MGVDLTPKGISINVTTVLINASQMLMSGMQTVSRMGYSWSVSFKLCKAVLHKPALDQIEE